MSRHQSHPETDAWLAAERRRHARSLAVDRILERPPLPSADQLPPVARLIDIAREVRARVDCGEFDLCFQHIRDDMASLPAELEAIAAAIEAAR